MYNYSKLTRKVCEILDEHDLIKEVFKENDKYDKLIFHDPDCKCQAKMYKKGK